MRVDYQNPNHTYALALAMRDKLGQSGPQTVAELARRLKGRYHVDKNVVGWVACNYEKTFSLTPRNGTMVVSLVGIES